MGVNGGARADTAGASVVGGAGGTGDEMAANAGGGGSSRTGGTRNGNGGSAGAILGVAGFANEGGFSGAFGSAGSLPTNSCRGISRWTSLDAAPDLPRDVPTRSLAHALGFLLRNGSRRCLGALVAGSRVLFPACEVRQGDKFETVDTQFTFTFSEDGANNAGSTFAALTHGVDPYQITTAAWSAQPIRPYDRLRVIGAGPDGTLRTLEDNVTTEALELNPAATAAEVESGKLFPAFADDGNLAAFCAADDCTIQRCVTIADLVQNSQLLRVYQAMTTLHWADVTGDGIPEAVVFDWSTSGVVDFTTSSRYVEFWTDEPYFGDVQNLVADVNGDGLADAVAINSDNLGIALSTGNSFTAALKSAFAQTRSLRRAGDVDNDGTSDLVQLNGQSLLVSRSAKTTFSAPVAWGSVSCADDCHLAVADANGDGFADAIVTSPAGIEVALSTGSTFENASFWLNGVSAGLPGWFFGDVTGDGAADAVLIDRNRAAVFASQKSAFAKAEQHWNEMPAIGERGNYIVDVNGDGMADVIVHNNSSTLAYLSSGASFTKQTLLNFPYYGGE